MRVPAILIRVRIPLPLLFKVLKTLEYKVFRFFVFQEIRKAE